MRKALTAVTLFPAFLFLMASSGWAQPRDWNYGPWGMGFWWAPMGMIMMLLFWGVVIFLIVGFFRGSFASGPPHSRRHSGAESPEDILKKRYARGEIEKEEFEEKLRVLKE